MEDHGGPIRSQEPSIAVTVFQYYVTRHAHRLIDTTKYVQVLYIASSGIQPPPRTNGIDIQKKTYASTTVFDSDILTHIESTATYSLRLN